MQAVTHKPITGKNAQATEPTTLSSWTLAVARTIQSFGIEPQPLLKQAGIDPSLLSQPGARVPMSCMSRLWKLAVEATGEEGFGLYLAEHITPTALHAFSYAVQASSTLREAVAIMQRFSRVISTAVVLETREENGHLHMIFKTPEGQPDPSYESMDAFLACAVNMGSWTFDVPAELYVGVCVRRPEPRDKAPYERFLRCPVTFNSTETSLVFNGKILDYPLLTANPELARVNGEVLSGYLARMQAADIIDRVRSEICELLPYGEPNQERVAAALNMSVRNLRRKLSEKGQSYKQLLDSIRHEQACRLLKQSEPSLGEIAWQLGFHDTSSFSRAFRRWEGTTPAKYRQADVLQD